MMTNVSPILYIKKLINYICTIFNTNKVAEACILRETILTLQKLVLQKTNSSVTPLTTLANKKEKEKKARAGQKALSDFMFAACEPITFVETREIWNDMCSTNNGAFPHFEKAFLDVSRRCYNNLLRIIDKEDIDTSKQNIVCKEDSEQETSVIDENDEEEEVSEVLSSRRSDNLLSIIDKEDSDCSKQNEVCKDDSKYKESAIDENNEEVSEDILSELASEINRQDLSFLSDEDLVHFASNLADGIKHTYSIRSREDKSELKFILCTIVFLWTTVGSIAIAGHYHSNNNPKIGSFTPGTLKKILMESFILFALELIWECFLSWIVLRYNIKINYTRKLGNLLKVPKYFIADFIPAFTSTALSMTMAVAINQTLFCIMYYRKSRERVPFFAYVFLSQDRREDRPDTLIFQVTEDIMRFAIYFPFKLLVVDLIQSKAIIFIPIAVNNIGDGLAEPIGVAYGKHKYSTTALYHKGRFFHSKFTRSYEGSACVFITTAIVVAANYSAFNTMQFWVTFSILPFLMTIGEARAPHTNDGPFLALIGCGFLSAIFLIGRDLAINPSGEEGTN